jgi:hypothetical protein
MWAAFPCGGVPAIPSGSRLRRFPFILMPRTAGESRLAAFAVNVHLVSTPFFLKRPWPFLQRKQILCNQHPSEVVHDALRATEVGRACTFGAEHGAAGPRRP